MEMELTEEQIMMRDMVRRFALDEVEPLAIAIDRDHRFPVETGEKMAELGLIVIISRWRNWAGFAGPRV
jgi:butyryl-CoA dehydrogenase